MCDEEKTRKKNDPLYRLKTRRGSERRDSVDSVYHVRREMLDEVLKLVIRLKEIFGKEQNKSANKKWEK